VIMLCKSIQACSERNYIAQDMFPEYTPTANDSSSNITTIASSSSGNATASIPASSDTTTNTNTNAATTSTPRTNKRVFKLDDIQKAFSLCEREYGVGHCIMKDGVIQRI
jgi:hypothetical protein